MPELALVALSSIIAERREQLSLVSGLVDARRKNAPGNFKHLIIIGIKRQILHPHDDATKSADTEESESRF